MLDSVGFRIAATLFTLAAVTAMAVAALPLLLAVGFVLVVASVLTFVLSTSIVRPISEATKAARRIAKGFRDARITPRPSGEIGDLADALNEMVATLDELIGAASVDHGRMLAALNSHADAVIALNEQEVITFANAAAGSLLGQREEVATGKPLAWSIPDALIVEAVRSSRMQGRAQTLVAERPNRRFLQVIVTPIIDGGEWTTLIVLRDISEVIRAEQVRRDFVANVSHELRTPLAAVKSVIDTLHAGAIEDNKTSRDFLSRADIELDRLVALVEELLQLSRIESGELALALEDLEVAQVVSAAADRMRPEADKRGLEISVSVPPSTPRIRADRDLLERALLNLIQNSVKYTPEGGSIDVSARTQNGLVTIDVSDTGEGIDPADLPRVFERFYKADRARRAGGTGLGLAIVKHTAEAHGGSVKAASELGKGSTFSLAIPVRSG